MSLATWKKEFEGKQYSDFKLKVGEAVADTVEPIRTEKNRILSDKGYLDSVLFNGAQRASALAYKTLNKVYRKVGLLQRKRG